MTTVTIARKWRTLLLCLLLAASFDAVVPVEPVLKTFQLDGEFEEAAQLRLRRDVSSATRAIVRERSVPDRFSMALRVESAPARVAAIRWEFAAARPLRASVASDPDPPAAGEDH